MEISKYIPEADNLISMCGFAFSVFFFFFNLYVVSRELPSVLSSEVKK